MFDPQFPKDFMSQNLLTYLLVGPFKLTCGKTLRAKILKKAETLVNAAKVCTFPQDNLSPAEEKQAEDKAIKILRAADIDGEASEQVASIDPEETLNGLLLLWENGSPDACSRAILINGKKMFVMAIGGDSYGDEPDGEGYAVVRDASRLGMLDALGIK